MPTVRGRPTGLWSNGRRAALGLGLVGLAAVGLVGCGDDDDTPTPQGGARHEVLAENLCDDNDPVAALAALRSLANADQRAVVAHMTEECPTLVVAVSEID